MVIELIDSVASEAEVAIQRAFADGYKAGVAEYKPEVARLAAVNDSLKRDLLKVLSKPSIPLWTLPLAGAVCFLGGFVGGVFIQR